ncbi:MAG: hypothetical protein ACFFCQ_13280 [Promethearchaeota archaeon]
MTGKINAYLKTITKQLQKQAVASELIEEFMDNLNDQLLSMLEEIEASDPSLSKEKAEQQVMLQCEPEEIVVQNYLEQLDSEDVLKTKIISKTPDIVIPTFTDRIYHKVKWYQEHIMATIPGLAITVMFLWLILGLGYIYWDQNELFLRVKEWEDPEAGIGYRQVSTTSGYYLLFLMIFFTVFALIFGYLIDFYEVKGSLIRLYSTLTLSSWSFALIYAWNNILNTLKVTDEMEGFSRPAMSIITLEEEYISVFQDSIWLFIMMLGIGFVISALGILIHYVQLRRVKK